MDNVLGEEIGKRCLVYVDDVLVLVETIKEHDDNVKGVIEKLTTA